ncbi:DUF6440 family protein [Streptococcus himalayensis]|uniref:DUF6440 domain-containing protein n=1 Tax=Streptococcus himalayensis TaxID=1888195 RepID=A0A917A3W0_9STRE|nr:DUF6440 family protein [Streptococcus himalayensis]GGE25268.1 hypothetical protein GCM10011510_02940 [Streptococcus himalayensis]
MKKQVHQQHAKDLVDGFEVFDVSAGFPLVIDKETGLEYLGTSKGGFTALLNPDGTPKISQVYQDGLL